MTISIKELQKQVHNTAREKGWWPLDQNRIYQTGTPQPINLEEVNIPEKLMLMVSELGEALEHYRSDVGMGGPDFWCAELAKFVTDEEILASETLQAIVSNKPDGFWIELADCIIRILDLAGAYDIDMEQLLKLKHEYNKTRPFRHGGKKC